MLHWPIYGFLPPAMKSSLFAFFTPLLVFAAIVLFYFALKRFAPFLLPYLAHVKHAGRRQERRSACDETISPIRGLSGRSQSSERDAGNPMPGTGGAFKEPRANGFQEAADCQVKGLPVHPLSFFWGKVADEGIWPDSNRGSCSSGKQPPPPARRVCLHKSTRFFHTPLAAAGRQGGHQRDAMSSRIYCRGLRRVEKGRR